METHSDMDDFAFSVGSKFTKTNINSTILQLTNRTELPYYIHLLLIKITHDKSIRPWTDLICRDDYGLIQIEIVTPKFLTESFTRFKNRNCNRQRRRVTLLIGAKLKNK